MADRLAFFKFSANGGQFTEKYGLINPGTEAQAKQYCVHLAKQRLLLCGNGVKLLGIRLSDWPATRAVTIIQPSEGLWTNPPALADANDGPEVERVTSSVLCHWTGVGNRAADRTLAGVPDKLLSETATNGLRLDRNVGWLNKWKKLRDILMQKAGIPEAGPWGFVSIDPPDQNNSASILSGANDPASGELKVNVAGDQRNLFAKGVSVRVVNNRRTHADFKGPNGKHVVQSSALNAAGDETEIQLQGLTGVDSSRWVAGSYGTIIVNNHTIVAFNGGEIVRATERSRKIEGFTTVRGRGRKKNLISA